MMKKQIKKWLMCFVAIAMTVNCTSCSKDDEPGGPVNMDKVQSSSIITNKNGEKLLVDKIGKNEIEYNEKGLPVRVGKFGLNYENGTISDATSQSSNGKFAMNKNGFVTEFEFAEIDEVESERYNVKFEYNSNGYLTKITSKCWYKHSLYGSDEETVTYTFKYNGDKLIGQKTVEESNYKEVEDGQEYSGTKKIEINRIVVSSIDNPLRQHTFSLSRFVDELDDFQLVGLYGKAPSNIPTEIKDEVTSYDTHYGERVYENSYIYSYTFNDDGTIETEKDRNGTYLYQYMHFGEQSSLYKSISEFNAKPEKSPRRIMRKKHRSE